MGLTITIGYSKITIIQNIRENIVIILIIVVFEKKNYYIYKYKYILQYVFDTGDCCVKLNHMLSEMFTVASVMKDIIDIVVLTTVVCWCAYVSVFF